MLPTDRVLTRIILQMAHGGAIDWLGNGNGNRVKCSYKKATTVVCTANLVAALYVLHTLLAPLYIFSPTQSSLQVLKYTEHEHTRMQQAIKVRRESEPVDLILRVKEIEEEALRENMMEKLLQSTREKLKDEVLRVLKELNADSNSTAQQVLEDWRKKKLEEAKKGKNIKAVANSTVQPVDNEMVAKVLESDWVSVLEEAGVPFNPETSDDGSGKLLQGGPEIEDGIIPGRTLPIQCHAEAHTDYDGIAVRWGLTHHKESAADCCQACLDQAKIAKVGEKKCNVWVYCPSESGCYSPDKYEHKHQECWLKQADNAKLNFKGRYSEAYRREHPSAPVVVPWVSGMTSS
ncbi:uncharacterized protein LOC131048563 isoform X1 [Cryptomeria japonica]|uniref:uncharacterized protein LOC131048563 isoform X1 n=1 Tax=Cryptomeria japonica TaxID=3369 RepID=UPI0025ABC5D5|nr:uncharacterized protein LOC131048563 isoform X1 [Cryptomeria japonica]